MKAKHNYWNTHRVQNHHVRKYFPKISGFAINVIMLYKSSSVSSALRVFNAISVSSSSANIVFVP